MGKGYLNCHESYQIMLILEFELSGHTAVKLSIAAVINKLSYMDQCKWFNPFITINM